MLLLVSNLILLTYQAFLIRNSKFEIRNYFLRTKYAGGDDGIRTHDPLLAGQVLSQLSYTPITKF